ncbi:phiSA1p31-related protein [Streptomyces sp. NPDC001658]
MNVAELAPDSDAGRECPCKDPDDQYLMQIDAGTVYLTHKACGKPPRAWLDDAFGTHEMPVTLHWHHHGPTAADDDDSSYGLLTINGRAVLHDDVPYLVDRQYADRDGSLWHITELVDWEGRPLVFLVPEGSGEYVPLGQIVADFGPLTLHREGS